MALVDQLTQDMKAAMKARDKERVQAVRLLLSNVKTLMKDKGDLSEKDEIAFLSTEAKRRRESIVAYDEAGRDDLSAKEKLELTVIQGYLPEQLSEDEVKTLIAAAIADTGASTRKDFPKVIKAVMPKVKGRFPGKQVKPLIESMLD